MARAGDQALALERVRWTGKMPFEMQQVQITPEGFRIRFTQPTDRQSARDPEHYQVDTFTHIYRAGYGGPEVDATQPAVREVQLSADGMEATLQLETLSLGHVHTIILQDITAADGTPCSITWPTTPSTPYPVRILPPRHGGVR